MWQAVFLLVLAGFLGGGAWSLQSQGRSRKVVVALVVLAVALGTLALWMFVQLQKVAA